MRKTMNLSVSEELHDFILRRPRERYHISVSEYIRSLVRQDKFRSQETPSVKKGVRTLRRANDCLSDLSPDLD